MQNLNFFTPLVYKYQTSTKIQEFFHAVEENIDAYFYLGGKRVLLVMKNENGIYIAKNKEGRYYANLETDRRADFKSCLIDAVKVASWFTVVIPAFLMAGKLLFRYMHHHYPLKITAKYGTLAFRREYIFKVLKFPLDQILLDQSACVNNVTQMLSKRNFVAKMGFSPDIEGRQENGAIEYVREVGKQFYADSNSFNRLALNNKTIYAKNKDPLLSKREIIANYFQQFAVKLVHKMSALVHQSFSADIVDKIYEILLRSFPQELTMIFKLTSRQNLEFNVCEKNGYTTIDCIDYISVGDAEVTTVNKKDFIDFDKYDLKEGLSIGYLGIFKRVTVPSKELIGDYKFENRFPNLTGNGLPNLKVDMVVTPFFRTIEEAKKSMLTQI